VRQQYATEIVAPRRARIKACLTTGIDLGDLPADADVLVAGSFVTGSWYSLALVGAEAPDDWALRTVSLVWRACGGVRGAEPGSGRVSSPSEHEKPA